jgi:L-iditol 2-dehydrogenase
MRAVVYRGPNNLQLETVPVPRTGPEELLVRVAACGVCPTDIKKIQHGLVPPPRIFGHETAGTIARVGARVRGWRVGERVALHHHVPCLDCHACRHRAYAQCPTYKRTGVTAGFDPAGGGYAEYVRVLPFALPGIVRIPARITFEEGALLEPVNTVLKAVRRLALLRGDVVWVAGQGAIGLLFTKLLALEGMKVVATDLLPARVARARAWGARWALAAGQTAADGPPQTQHRKAARRNASTTTPFTDSAFKRFALSTLRRITCRRGLDAAILATPANALVPEAQTLVRGGGQILLFAHTKRGERLALDPAAVCVDEQDILGSYSSDLTIQNEVARLVFSRKLDVRLLITHRFPLAQTAAAVALAARPTPSSLKVVVVQGEPSQV